jgi:shikimate kinase
MTRNHIIYIIGFMGSGKSYTGRKLASILGWTFIDLDKKIEEHTGKTIPEIFSQEGEDWFREIETSLLRKLNSVKNTIISTGGGAPCYSNNMDFMLKNGLTLYLKLTPEELHVRLSQSKGERPLIKNLDKDDLQNYIEGKLADREKCYSRSDITVTGLDPDINLLISLIKSRLGGC